MNYPLGGRLSYFLPFWHTITRDAYVLCNVRHGIHIPLTSKVVQHKSPFQIKMNEVQKQFVDNKVQTLLDQKCIVQKSCLDKSGFVSNIFLVLKKDNNSFRMILNLKHLNKFVQVPHFKMDSIKDIQRLVAHNFFVASCDITDAFPHLLASKSQQNLLQFIWRDRVYTFCTMPQGLATAPYKFTHVCRQIAGYL